MGRPKKPPRLVVNTCEHCGTEYSIPFKQRKQRFCSNKCSASFPANINQRTRTMRKTWLEKYGKNPMQLEETKDKFRETMLKKHGVEFSQQKKEFVEKSKQTKFENFGNRNFNNRELAKQTILKKKLKFNKKIPEDQFKQEMLAEFGKYDNVFEHGRIGQDKLLKERIESNIHYYAGNFPEIDCISVRESASVGCVPFTSNLAAFTDDTKDYVITTQLDGFKELGLRDPLEY